MEKGAVNSERPSTSAKPNDESTDDETSLKISLTPERNRSKSSPKRKRKRPKAEDEERYIDKAIEEKLQECAKRNKLTAIEMRKLLRTFVLNDHILALVKIQEEEELVRESATDGKGNESSGTEDEKIDNEVNDSPKLTRSKARELNQKPIPISSLSEIQPEPEIAALIADDLHSDEEDEEYEPREEDYASDDDPNTTVSDIDSQPCTPKTPANNMEYDDDHSQSQYTEDGLFKVPPSRDDSGNQPQEEIIAKRTRSKVCLQETAIETIESNFIPPDITTDMYDFDMEIDNAWKEFLINFSAPPDPNAEDDDEGDPEYVAADHEPIDSEELKDINISKKELSDLVAELFDGLVQDGIIDDIDINSSKKSPEKSPQKKKPKIDSGKSELQLPSTTIVDPIVHPILPTNGPLHINESLIQTNPAVQFNPTVVSTPNNYQTKTVPEARFEQVPLRQNDPSNDSGILSQTNQLSAVVPSNFTSFLQSSETGLGSRFVPVTIIPISATSGASKGNTFTLVSVPPTCSGGLVANRIVATDSQSPSVPGLPRQIFLISDDLSSTQPGLPATIDSSQVEVIEIATPQVNTVSLPTKSEALTQSATSSTTKTTLANEIIISSDEENLTANQINVASNKNQTRATIKSHPVKTKPRPQAVLLDPNVKRMGVTVYPPFGMKTKSLRQEFKAEYSKKYAELKRSKIVEVPQFDEKRTGFTETQKQILAQQLRMHVQFLAQHYIQVYSHPTFWKRAETVKDMLLQLDKLYNSHKDSAFNIINLKLAAKLIVEWEKELSISCPENSAMMEFIYSEMDKAKKRTSSLKHVTRFPPRIMKRIISSPAFIYGHLLPTMPFRPEESIYFEMIPALDQIIAHCLYDTFNELEDYERSIRPQKPKRVSLTRVCQYIARSNVIQGKSGDSLYDYVRKMMLDEMYNPIKYYFEHKKPPPYKHELYQFNPERLTPPEDRHIELPTIWKEFVARLRALEIEKTCHPQRYARAINAVRDYGDPEFNVSKSKRVNNNSNISIQVNCVYNSQNNITTSSVSTQPEPASTSYHQEFPPLLDNFPPILPPPNAHQELTKRERFYSQTDYSSVFTQVHAPISTTDSHQDLSIYKLGNNYDTSSDYCFNFQLTEVPNEQPNWNNSSNLNVSTTTERNESINVLYPPNPTINASGGEKSNLPKGQKLLTDYFKIAEKTNKQFKNHPKALLCLSKWPRIFHKTIRLKAKKRKRLIRKLENRQRQTNLFLKEKITNLSLSYRRSTQTIYDRYQNALLRRVFVKIKALEIFASFLDDFKMQVKKMKTNSDGLMKKDLISLKSATAADDEAPKTRKPYRVGESLRQMLLPESKEDRNEKDANFARNFYEKIEETFGNDKYRKRFEEFQAILKAFDSQKDRVADLYQKMEKLFLPDFPELAELFLIFLLPTEAIEIGKFFEHFMITNMTSFVNKLNIFFNKQPAQIKKVYSALNELAEEKDVTVEQIKAKILPLLKGNKFLTDWFLQSFETEKPSESISSVYETVNLKQLESQQSETDCYETVSQKDIIDEPSENHPCQLKYINGGIYYGSRILLPAKLSFLATELAKTAESRDDEESTSENELDMRLTSGARVCCHGFRDFAEKRLKTHLEKSDEENKSEEEDEKDKQTYTLCDDITFKAHAARLNPALYPAVQNFHFNRNSDSELSHKKQCLQRRRSPKKSTPKSPLAGAKKQSSAAQLLHGDSSKAIGIAKKLKAITSGNVADSETTLIHLKTKRKPSKNPKNEPPSAESSGGSQASSDGGTSDTEKFPEPKRKQLKLQSLAHVADVESSSTSSSVQIQSSNIMVETISSTPSPVPSIDEVKASSSTLSSPSSVWTRDEDKIILEEVKSGYYSECSLVSRLMHKLPHRNETEITNRHLFLMQVLTRLQGKTSTG